MNENLNIVKSIEIEELKNKIQQQKKILLELLEKWYYYKFVAQPKIVSEYEAIFGDLIKKIDENEELCASLERKIDLFFVKFKRGERITRGMVELIEKTTSFEAQQNEKTQNNRRKRQDHSNFAYKEANQEGNSNGVAEITRMYRKLVKILHPDLAGETEIYRKFWNSIQEAYKTKNYHRLRVFYKTIGDDNFNLPDDTDIAERYEQEYQELKLMIGIERRMLERMLNSEPFIYEKELKNVVWVEDHRRTLNNKLSRLEKRIESNKKLLDQFESLMGE